MSYSEPPEWQGRGSRSREGWPGGSASRDVPRSHRADPSPNPDPRGTPVGEDTVRVGPGAFRAGRVSYDDMPTDPSIRPLPATRRNLLESAADPEPGVRHIVLPVSNPKDPVERFDLWLRVAVHMLGVVALLAAIWCLGMVIAVRGVPLWVPRQ